jgi:cell division protein FtsB
MKVLSCNLLLVLLVVTNFSCTKAPEKDPRVEKLQNDVKQLAEQNKKLESEVERLQTQLNEQQSQPALPEAQTQETVTKMTVDRMKKEIKPALDKAIQDLKKSAETPRTANQFGMRVEYDLKKAFYGLIDTGNERVPYQAKVIVTYEKFLESGTESKSYGKGSTMLMFAHRNNHWELISSK